MTTGFMVGGVDVIELFEPRQPHHEVVEPTFFMAADGRDLAEHFAPRSGKHPSIVTQFIAKNGLDIGEIFEPRQKG